MAQPIRNITIVGGGTSGWISATYLAVLFQQKIQSGDLSITVIESPDIAIIGVGESTARPMADLLRIIGIKESTFIKRCNATFKLSGLFSNWDVDENGKGVTWINPFFSQDELHGVNPAYLYAQYSMHEGGGPIDYSYTDAISICPGLIRNFKGPRPFNAGDYQSEVPYSYHMDAIELAKILMERGKSLGVKQILDTVEDVKLDEREFITELTLKENGAHPVEFVIDATGFASILIGKAMGEPFESYEDYLLNDRAAVAQLPHEDPTKIEPTSRATGMNAGWSFRVPLFNRVGSGYVYSSKFLSDDEAIDEFKKYVANNTKNVDAEKLEPRVIRMRIGKVRKSWKNNCLAIGLSSGFVEPLEATAIYSVQVALQWLYNYFPDTDFDPAVQDRYNKLVDGLYEEIIDFISLLFCTSNREDTDYWRTVRHDMKIPPRLKENLAVWKSTMPDEADLPTRTFFTPTSYRSALMGKRFFKGRTYAQTAPLPEQAWRHYVDLRQQRTQKFINDLPGHYELLKSIRDSVDAPAFQLNQSILKGSGL